MRRPASRLTAALAHSRPARQSHADASALRAAAHAAKPAGIRTNRTSATANVLKVGKAHSSQDDCRELLQNLRLRAGPRRPLPAPPTPAATLRGADAPDT